MRRKLSFNKKGFTLLELLFVIIILGILITIGIFQYGNVQEKANINVDQADLRLLNSSVQLYAVEKEKPPQNLPSPFDQNISNINDPKHELFYILGVNLDPDVDRWPRAQKFEFFEWNSEEGKFFLVKTDN